SSPNLESEPTYYDLFGNPESASFAKKILEGALIYTTASLFGFLLIRDEKRAGKIFHDLDSNTRFTAELVCKTNPLIIILSGLLNYRWKTVSINGCIPTLQDLNEMDVCQFVMEHPQEYIDKIREKISLKFNKDFKEPIHELIKICQLRVENGKSKFDLKIEHEFPQFDKIKNKVINDLKKLQSRAESGKRVTSKDFDGLKENFEKNCAKINREFTKEFQNFNKEIEEKLTQTPPWFKYIKKDSHWELESSNNVLDRLNSQLTTTKVMTGKKTSRSLQNALTIFQQFGGIQFAIENIVAHYFYECIPPRLLKFIEAPAKREKAKELKFLKEMRYIEGLETVRKFLVSYSEVLISSLIDLGFEILKGSYINHNPRVHIAENQVRNPHYLSLLDLPKEILDEISLEEIFGKDYFLFQTDGSNIHIGLHLKSLNGKGNELFSLLVSSSALENSLIYKKATRILGNFSGYVYHTAIGNMRVCPPALKAIDDLFM
ncbi:MAG: hypothetical protein ACXACR_04165, partial [Candidatus Hodarchaeales archaeon]